MRSVGIRALQQNASAIVAEAAAGEVITITHRGRPVAQIIPLPAGHLETLVASRRARPPKTSLADLGPPQKRRSGDQPLSSVLREMRDEERY